MQELTQNDFFQGLIATLATRGVRSVSIRTDNFDPVLRTVFERLERRAPAYELELDFDIIPDPTHGDSLVVRDILAAGAADGLISYDNPEYQDIEIKLGRHGGELLLGHELARLRPLFDELAQVFMDGYERTPLT